jgi:hypothetical protein
MSWFAYFQQRPFSGGKKNSLSKNGAEQLDILCQKLMLIHVSYYVKLNSK